MLATPADKDKRSADDFEAGTSEDFTRDSTRSAKRQLQKRGQEFGESSYDSNQMVVRRYENAPHVILKQGYVFSDAVATAADIGGLTGAKQPRSTDVMITSYPANAFGFEGSGTDVEADALRSIKLLKLNEAILDAENRQVVVSGSGYGGTNYEQHRAMQHAEDFMTNQRAMAGLSDLRQKAAEQSMYNPHVAGSPAIPGANSHFNRSPDGLWGEVTIDNGLRSNTAQTYINGNDVDDGSYSGDYSEFYAPEFETDGITVKPAFVSDFIIMPYTAAINDYVYGQQYLFENNARHANGNIIFTDERLIFRNMYYDDVYVFADHEKDFTRVYKYDFHDHLYDFPSSIYKPQDQHKADLKTYEDEIDTRHTTKMTEIMTSTSQTSIDANYFDWNNHPYKFLKRKGALYDNATAVYNNDKWLYGDRAIAYDTNSITYTSDPVLGLPWLNSAKAEYVSTIGNVHHYHSRRDIPLINSLLAVMKANTNENFVTILSTAFFTMDQALFLLDTVKGELEQKIVDQETKAATLVAIGSVNEWITKFVIQGLVVDLNILAGCRSIVSTSANTISLAKRFREIIQLLKPKLDKGSEHYENAERLVDEAEALNNADITAEDTVPDDGYLRNPLVADSWPPNPYTMATAQSEAQYKEYVDSGGKVRPTGYPYFVTLFSDDTDFNADSFDTWREMLERRIDYSFRDHGHIHNIDITERMPETAFNEYLSTGTSQYNRIVPLDFNYPRPRYYPLVTTYRSYLEGLIGYVELEHRDLYGWFDPTDLTNPNYDPINDPNSIERMQEKTYIQPDGYQSYTQYIQSRSNYYTTLAKMYTESEFIAFGMDEATHPYELYVRLRIDYPSTVFDMKDRAEFGTVVQSVVSYDTYRIERSDYDEFYHVWDDNDNLIPTWWQRAELQARTKSDWEPSKDAYRITGLPAWRLVRYLPSTATAWHPVDDNLAGTAAAYGNKGDSTAKFNLIFNGVDDEVAFTEFLISTPTFSDWVYFDKNILDNPGSNMEYTCKRTVHNPNQSSMLRWFNRTSGSGQDSVDPQISSRDSASRDRVLYVEDSLSHASYAVEGSMVFVR